MWLSWIWNASRRGPIRGLRFLRVLPALSVWLKKARTPALTRPGPPRMPKPLPRRQPRKPRLLKKLLRRRLKKKPRPLKKLLRRRQRKKPRLLRKPPLPKLLPRKLRPTTLLQRKRLTPDRFLELGAIRGAHGLKGALTVYSNTRPAEAIAGYSFWWLGHSPDALTRYAVKRCWQHGRRILVELEGINDCNQAELCKGMNIWVPHDDVEVGEDEFLWDDLIGCEVFRTDNELLGTVTALEEYGAQDILVVATPEDARSPGEWMLPFIEEVVQDVDMNARRIVIELPEGMDACFTPRF
ncbi:MAG: ribosome maturation factor RimM [Mariprofundaceae bacterium]